MTDGNSSGPSHKEMARIFWMVKGYFPSDKMMEESYNGYVRRLWWNEEAYLREDGFEEAYQKKFK